jgi:hypothetical protein
VLVEYQAFVDKHPDAASFAEKARRRMRCCAAGNSDEHDEGLLSIALLAEVLPPLLQEVDRTAWDG